MALFNAQLEIKQMCGRSAVSCVLWLTALIPAIANAFLNMVSMTDVISQYSCESIILVFGSGLITLPWVSMLNAAGYDQIHGCKPAVPILLFIVVTAVTLTYMLFFMPSGAKSLEGTKEYFKESYHELGPTKLIEKVCGVLFLLAMVLAFTRPFYAELLPGMVPAYSFLAIGFVCFFLNVKENGAVMTWEAAQKGTMWDMMILFASGLAIGKLLNGSGATDCLADMVTSVNMDGGLTIIIGLVVFTRLITEVTNGTTAAAIVCPLVISVTTKMGLNPLHYWFLTCMSFNAEWLLPISVRAVPVSYGLDPDEMLTRGIPITLIHTLIVIVFGYIAITFFPNFGDLPYLFA